MSRIEREVLQVQEKTKLLEYYRQMLAIRRLEEASAKAYSQGKIGGFLHLYIGQEAVAVGAVAALKPEDYVITTYRDHGHAYAKGMSARGDHGRAVRQGDRLLARASAARCTSSTPRPTSSAATASSAATCRWPRAPPSPSKYRGDGRVTPVLLRRRRRQPGRGPRGASRWPRCGSCRSSSSARTTSTRWARRSTARCRSRTSSQKALAYGMARDRFDGDDVIKVRDRIAEAVRRARYESQPTLIEIRCYRFRGHSMSDPGQYRTKEEVEECKKQRLPLRSRQQYLREAGRRTEGARRASRRASRPRSRTR